MWRNARDFDDDAIVALCLALNREDPGQQTVSAAQVLRSLQVFRQEPWRGRALVLELPEGLSGYAFLVSTWSNELGGSACVIDEMYVSPAVRSRGHGTALVEGLATGALWPDDVATLCLEVSSANDRARALYQRLGFSGDNTVLVRRLREHRAPRVEAPRIYGDRADWYRLLTPVADYAEETALYRQLFARFCARAPQTLLDLGCGAGHNAFHLKPALALTLVDISSRMLDLSRELNPECEHIQGDMRTVRLGRTFDCVLVHDAVSHMITLEDLHAAIASAYAHCAPGGAALFLPDHVRETFAPGTDTGGSDGADGRGLRYLEWFESVAGESAYLVHMACMLRSADGFVEVVHDRMKMGLFPRATWLELIAAAGFDAHAVPFEHSCVGDGHEIFVGTRKVGSRPSASYRDHRSQYPPCGSF